ncbi:OmpA family protein [Parasphingorhabdus sp.]|uniref:OmpA family protein n=1 Tax=Parasphingorhabdus sp. TaxID=2709688 RepID=UPI003262E70B
MEVGSKILTGAAATVILALAGHAATGENFIAGLEQEAQTELAAQGLDAASVSFDRAPLSRSAVLDGELAEDAKQKALSVVMAVPGVSSARWKGEKEAEGTDGDGTTGPTANSAAQQEIARCQEGVDKLFETKKISFRSGSAYISPETNRLLDALAETLQSCDGLSIAVDGHTDSNGDPGVNQIMSQERADRIKAGLVERGASENLIIATGYGSTQPRATGSGAAADAENRRIEFRIGSTNGASQNDAKAQQGK